MHALDFLGMAFADGILFRGEVTCVCAPLIRKVLTFPYRDSSKYRG